MLKKKKKKIQLEKNYSPPPATKRGSRVAPHTLLPCQIYPHFNSIPYQLRVMWHALVMMHLHSHLCKNEVIGLLGGHWDALQKSRGKFHFFEKNFFAAIIVQEAFPAKSLSSDQENVEMDPIDELRIREKIRARGVKKNFFFPLESNSIDEHRGLVSFSHNIRTRPIFERH